MSSERVPPLVDFDYYDGDARLNRPPEWLTEYYEDHFPEPVDFDFEEGDVEDEVLMKAFGTAQSVEEILEHCVQPTVSTVAEYVGVLLVWCIAFRMVTQLGKFPLWTCHWASVVSGLGALWFFFNVNTVYICALAVMSHLMLFVSHRWVGRHGIIVTGTCLAFNFLCEFYIAPSDWLQIRGAQMILTMKAISVSCDLDDSQPRTDATEEKSQEKDDSSANPAQKRDLRQRHQVKKTRLHSAKERDRSKTAEVPSETVLVNLAECPSLSEYLGYALCPGTVIFGPWIKYVDYIRILKQPRWNFAWLWKILCSFFFGLLFLTISDCWTPWFIPDGIGAWWTAYKKAVSFRASHYFISYMSEATAVTAGIQSKEGDWNLEVAQPVNVEVPRSLKEVAKSWDRPKHDFLKYYCFKKTITSGMMVAYLTTFAASVVLHGMSFELGAVLLSLGVFAYAEYELRRKLATIFNASIAASRSDIRYRHREGAFHVVLVNCAFGLLATFNLTYLGVIVSREDAMADGYSWRHALVKWEELSYLAHTIMGILFVIAKLL